ncbi:acyl-CoA thioesterase [Trypanosoma cruzi]|nr:acyl-CoA thioesterase [Trypanosoma cruzi]
MLLQDVIGEFLSLPPRALQLERVSEDIFCSVYLWTPTHSKATYGGQLVAHCVEAAYLAADDPHTDIISLQLKFLSAGRSDCGSPVVYSVKSLHNGRSFFPGLCWQCNKNDTYSLQLLLFLDKSVAALNINCVCQGASLNLH